MDIGKEQKPIIVEPAQNPVPQKEPAERPRRKTIPARPGPSRKPEKEPAKK